MDIVACLLAPWSSGKDPGFVTLVSEICIRAVRSK
jgi:hypothetical protein